MDLFVSKILKNRRMELGLSQEELAEQINVDARTIRRIENNEIKRSPYLKDICLALNISFKEASRDEILSEHRSYSKPNVTTGLELAHLLYSCDHLDYYPDPTVDLEFEDNLIVEDFINAVSEIMELLEIVELEVRRSLVSVLDSEIKTLNKHGVFLYGSCNDKLINDFKYTELVFIKC